MASIKYFLLFFFFLMTLMPILIRNDSGKYGKSVMIDSHAPVKDLKHLIEGLFGYPPERQMLSFNKSYLTEDYRTLSYYGIGPNSLVQLYYKLPGGTNDMQIFIKALSGKVTTLRVQPTHTIQHIKQMLLNTEGIPTECVMLIYGGIQLTHQHYTLEQYCIKNESTMHLVVRLPGGR